MPVQQAIGKASDHGRMQQDCVLDDYNTMAVLLSADDIIIYQLVNDDTPVLVRVQQGLSAAFAAFKLAGHLCSSVVLRLSHGEQCVAVCTLITG